MIYLRKLNMNDLNTTHAYSSDFENTYYMLNSEFSNIKETEKYLEKCINEYEKTNPTFITFAVVYNEIHVGEVFATLSKDGTIIGWIINKNYWRKGIATTAANMLIDILKNEGYEFVSLDELLVYKNINIQTRNAYRFFK